MHQILFDDIARIREGRQGRNIFLPELVLALDPDQMRKKVVKPHQPFRTAEVFSKFLQLANEYGYKERSIGKTSEM